MTKKKTKSSQKSKKRQNTSSCTSYPLDMNFLPDAGPGCHIARQDMSPSWMIEWEKIDPTEFETEEVPDVAIDTEEQTLSLCNIDSATKVAYITVYETRVVGANGEELCMGKSMDNQGVLSNCVTLIVLCPPRTFAHLCFLDVPPDRITQLRIESDVQEWAKHPNPKDEHPRRIGFPLQGGPFLCTQGVDGGLTHFFSGNLHAIDFRCPVGTPLLAVDDGVVVEAKDTNTLTGIAITHLFEWNSILVRLDDIKNGGSDGKAGPLFVEYVHIQKSLVKSGDRVFAGQVIGESGSVGFSPEPHLHFSAFRSSEPTAPTVRVRFLVQAEGTEAHKHFLPKAGCWYDASGLVTAPS